MLDPGGFLKLLKSGKHGHTYLFISEEEHDFRAVYSEIEAKLYPDGLDDFNFDRLDGKETDLVEIVETAGTLPMMSDRKLLLIKNSQNIKDFDIETFTNFISGENDHCFTLLKADSSPMKTKWAKALSKNNLVVNFPLRKEADLSVIVMKNLKKAGYRVDPSAAKYLVSQVGSDLDEISRQVARITVLCNKSEPITTEIIRDNVLRSRRRKYWELGDAAGNKNLKETMLILNEMLEDGEAEPLILGILSNFFKKISTARKLMDSGASRDQVCDAVSQKWYRDKFINQVRNFNAQEVKNVFSAMRQADENIKSGFLTPVDNLNRLALTICTGKSGFPGPDGR